MHIRKIISRLFICIVCILCLHSVSFAANNLPYGDVGEYGNWLTVDNIETFSNNVSEDIESFQHNFESNIKSSNFVPVEAKLGLVFMRALSSIDYVLQISLVRFTVIFLFVMYAFWIALYAYKMIGDSTDYKTVLFDIFKKGALIAVWVIVLEYGVANLFNLIIGPILSLGTIISDFILNTVADMYHANVPDTCSAIKQYVNEQVVTNVANSGKVNLLINSETAANIMCLPGRLSVYFYHAIATGFDWMIHGGSVIAFLMGAICIVVFVKCIFKYAFMTLGIVTDLFLRLLMLPFTAIAETSAGAPDSKIIPGRIYDGFLKIFSAEKLSNVISVFINTAIYFVSLSIVISICAALLTNVIYIDSYDGYSSGSAMTFLLCGCLVLYLVNQADSLSKKIGGDIDNSFGEKLKDTTKNFGGIVKDFAGKAYKDWIKPK